MGDLPSSKPLPSADVTSLLEKASSGDALAADQLLPLLYEELRRLATCRMAEEKPGQTLQATALVHEAYCRLIGPRDVKWNSRSHFFGAAAEAMRRILVEKARRKRKLRNDRAVPVESIPEDSQRVIDQDRILDVDRALNDLAASDSRAAEIVKLHFFAGLTLNEVASALDLSRATVFREWAYARAQLKLSLRDNHPE